MCMYIIPGDKLGNLDTVIKTNKTEIWTNQKYKVLLFNEWSITTAKLMVTAIKLMTSFQTNCSVFISTSFSRTVQSYFVNGPN